MRVRNVRLEWEAVLAPAESGAPAALRGARGKAEWKVYGDGARRCKVSVSRLNLPDDATLQLVAGGALIGYMTVQQGTARYRRESEQGESVPEIATDQILQVSHAGRIILEGRFYAE